MRLVLILAAALLYDAVRTYGTATTSGALLVAVAAACVVATGGRPTRGSALLAGTAVVIGVFLAIRAAPWLTALNATAAAGALSAAALLKRRGGVFDVAPSGLAALVAGAERVGAIHREVGGRVPGLAGVAVVRGVLLAVPVAGLLLMLLASADAVFAHLLMLDVPANGLGGHLGALGAGASGALLLAAIAGHAPGSVGRRGLPATPRAEAVVVLIAADAILGAFVTTQAVAALGGADAVVQSAHLSYAEYARTGFFQLVAVAVVMLVVVGTIRSLSRRTRALTILSVAAVCLTLVVVAIAAQRMRLYADAYGLTVLRLTVLWAILWIAIALGLIGIALCGARARRRWLTGALGLSAAVVLIAMNFSNPEATVARVNIERAHGGAAIDLAYLQGLSADAAQTLAREPLTSSIVVGLARRETGVLGWNLARATAPG
jgi:Domain of unknown function (DUF4173)